MNEEEFEKFIKEELEEDEEYRKLIEEIDEFQKELLKDIEEVEGTNSVCKHPSLPLPKFDLEKASSMTSEEVQKIYPRITEYCPDCKHTVTLYASFMHYVAGDW